MRSTEPGEGQLFQCVQDRQQDAFAVHEDVVVPKPQYPITLTAEICITMRIACAFRMLPAINFDNERPFAANEVDYERADGLLRTNLCPLSLLSRRANHSFLSASVWLPRSLRSTCTFLRSGPRIEIAPHPAHRFAVRHPLPAARGEGKKQEL